MDIKMIELQYNNCIFDNAIDEIIYRNFGRVPNERLEKILSISHNELNSIVKKLGLANVKFNPAWIM